MRRSTITFGTLYLFRSRDRVIPTGPAPTMMYGTRVATSVIISTRQNERRKQTERRKLLCICQTMEISLRSHKSPHSSDYIRYFYLSDFATCGCLYMHMRGVACVRRSACMRNALYYACMLYMHCNMHVYKLNKLYSIYYIVCIYNFTVLFSYYIVQYVSAVYSLALQSRDGFRRRRRDVEGDVDSMMT